MKAVSLDAFDIIDATIFNLDPDEDEAGDDPGGNDETAFVPWRTTP